LDFEFKFGDNIKMSQSLAGTKIKPFKSPSSNGGIFEFKNLDAEYLVLYFYPKDATPGCTLEGNEFSTLSPKFKKYGARILGVSRDSIKSHQKFCEKQGFKFDLLSDEDESLCQVFGVMKEKNMYGKKVWGIERSTFLISSSGKILREWRKVKAEGHAQDVLKVLEEICT
jgi:peroxiredoxin Q/BCP